MKHTLLIVLLAALAGCKTITPIPEFKRIDVPDELMKPYSEELTPVEKTNG